MNVDRNATLRASSCTPYARMALRWMSLSSGNGALQAFANAACANVLSALMPRMAAPRSRIFGATSPRPASSGVQIPPKS
jgi:hypothetical protein